MWIQDRNQVLRNRDPEQLDMYHLWKSARSLSRCRKPNFLNSGWCSFYSVVGKLHGAHEKPS